MHYFSVSATAKAWFSQCTCFQTVETAPKLDSEKTAFVSEFTVFLRGVRVVGGGGDYIYIYICAYGPVF